MAVDRLDLDGACSQSSELCADLLIVDVRSDEVRDRPIVADAVDECAQEARVRLVAVDDP